MGAKRPRSKSQWLNVQLQNVRGRNVLDAKRPGLKSTRAKCPMRETSRSEKRGLSVLGAKHPGPKCQGRTPGSKLTGKCRAGTSCSKSQGAKHPYPKCQGANCAIPKSQGAKLPGPKCQGAKLQGPKRQERNFLVQNVRGETSWSKM